MSNTIMNSSAPRSPWRYAYGISLTLLIAGVVAYGLSFGANLWIESLYAQKATKLNEIEQAITQMGSEKAFFSYQFAQELEKKSTTKRSHQITTLINVLRQVQANNAIGPNAIQLSDFSISPTELKLKGKVSNLLLLYHTSAINNYTNLIDRFAQLPFISNIAIKTYNKVDNFYEFSLTADINPHVILEPQQLEQHATSTTMNTNHTMNSSEFSSGANSSITTTNNNLTGDNNE